MKKYISFILLFILLLLAMSYYEKQKSKKELEAKPYTSVFDSLLNEMESVDNLISIIESSKRIESKYLGFEGESAIYSVYEKLLDQVSDSLWVELSYSKSPVMRYYACMALFSNESADYSSVRDRLIKDTSHVCSRFGCIVFDSYPLGKLIEDALQ